MKNYIQPGDTITLTAPAAVSSGDIVVVGSITGIAVADAANGADVEVHRKGLFTLTKVEAQAWTAGDRIYENGSGLATNVASTNKFLGVTPVAAANPSTTGTVLLTGSNHL